MVCSKCGYHFPIRASVLLQSIFNEDEFVRVESQSEFAVIGRLLLDDYQAIAIAIDNLQTDYESTHQKECLAFIDAVSLSIKERLPFISFYDAVPTVSDSIQPQIVLLADAINKLSELCVPHITVLTNVDSKKNSFVTYFPIGDIVIADIPNQDMKVTSTKTVNGQNVFLNNQLDSNQLMIDLRIDRRKLADILEKFVIFFMID
jgi:acetyl-CoA carboxylase beta subunit